MVPFRASWSERAETTVPAGLVFCSFVIDALGEPGAAAHALALGLRSLALVLCGVGAVRGLGRFGDAPLARRFAIWRAFGLLAAVFCLGLALLARWPLLLQPTDGAFALDGVAVLWLRLTGSAWDRASWERLAGADGEARPAPPAIGWRDLGTAG